MRRNLISISIELRGRKVRIEKRYLMLWKSRKTINSICKLGRKNAGANSSQNTWKCSPIEDVYIMMAEKSFLFIKWQYFLWKIRFRSMKLHRDSLATLDSWLLYARLLPGWKLANWRIAETCERERLKFAYLLITSILVIRFTYQIIDERLIEIIVSLCFCCAFAAIYVNWW